MSSFSLKRTRTNTWNGNGDNTQSYRSPCVTSNHSERSPSSVRTRARMPSWNWRITTIIFAGTPKRVRTFHTVLGRQSHAVSAARWSTCPRDFSSHVQNLAIDARRTACRLLIVRDESRTVPQRGFPGPRGSCSRGTRRFSVSL